MTIPSVVLSNTFNEFRTITNQAIAQLNALESGTGSIVADNVNANLVNASVALRANNVTTLTGGTLVINTNGGANTGAITINSGLNGNIAITPNGTGNVVVTSLNATGNVNITGTLGVTGATTFASSVNMSGGTANGVAYLNASKALTTGSALTFDGSILDVAGTVRSSTNISGNATIYAKATTGGASLVAESNSRYWRFFTSNTDPTFRLVDETAAQTRLTVDTTGNLGIGTSSPTLLLQVASRGGMGADGIFYWGSALTGNNRGILSWNTDIATIGTPQNLVFCTNSVTTERMRLDSSGNLGLGVTPSAWTGTFKAAQVSLAAFAYDNANGLLEISNNSFAGSAGVRNYITNNAATRYLQSIAGSHQWSVAASGTAGNAITFTQVMTLNALGNLGIGTTTPSTRLTIANVDSSVNTQWNGASLSTNDLGASTGNIGVYLSAPYASGTVNQAFFRVKRGTSNIYNGAEIAFNGQFRLLGSTTEDTSERVRISATGNFGIGVTNPGYTLDVGGAIQANTFFRLDSSGTLVGAIGYASSLLGSGGNDWLFYNTQATNIRFYTNNLERLRLDSSGNLGLNVTPSAWTVGRVFEISNAFVFGQTQQAIFGTNAYYDTNVWKYKITGTSSRFDIASTGAMSWHIAPSGTAGANATYTQVMTLDASGRLLLGTTSSTGARIDSNGDVAGVFDGLNVSNQSLNSAAVTRITLGSQGANWFLDNIRNGGHLSFTRGTTEAARFDSSGNFGIGTTSPGGLLGVNGAVVIGNQATTGADGSLRLITSGGINYIQSGQNRTTANAAPLVFADMNASSEWMRITNTGSVGIGTSSPATNLEVSGSAARVRVSGTAGSIAQLQLSSAGVVNWALRANNDGGSDFTIFQDSTQRLKIDSSGNVGIGTGSPAYRLSVQGAVEIRSAGALHLRDAANTNFASVFNSSGSMVFETAFTERMRLDASGNLGLGVTPSAWLGGGYIDFPGNGYIGNAATYSTNTLSLGLNTYYGNGNWRYKSSSLAASRFDNTNGSFAWHIAPSGTAGANVSFTQAMTLDASGNLGIGTSSPASKLHVSNTAAATRITITDDVSNGRSGYIESNYSDALVIGTTSGVRGIRFSPDNTTRMYLDTVGNVGIGTTTPGVRLDVNGGSIRTTSWVDITPSTATNNALYRATNTGGIFYSGLDNSAGGVTGVGYAGVLWHTGNYPLVFAVNNAEQMRLTATGNLGIGTSSPSAKLEIRRDVQATTSLDATAIKLFNNLDGGLGIEFTNGVAGKSKISFGVEASGAGTDDTYLGFSTSLNGGALTEQMRLTSGGNLGIGTSSPVSALGFGQTASGTGITFQSTDTTFNSGRVAVVRAAVSGSGIGALLFETYQGGSGGGERMRLDDAGNLGIGTNAPGARLDVNGSSRVRGDFFVYGTGDRLNIFPQTANNGANIVSTNNGNSTYAPLTIDGSRTSFNVGGTEQMRLTATGLGIGTSTPGVKLDVIGSIRATGSITAGALVGLDTIYIGPNGATGNGTLLVSANNDMSAYRPLTTDASLFLWRTNATERLRLDTSGNLGLGVTPNTWTNFVAAEVSRGNIAANSTEIDISHNAYFNSGWKYTANGFATNFYQANGSYVWRTAANNVAGAGAGATFSTTMVLDANGDLSVGATSPYNAARISSLATATKNAFSAYVPATSSYTGFYVNRIASDGDFVTFDRDTVRIGSIQSSSNSLIVLIGNTTEAIRITPTTARVGIGDSNPAEKLTVAGGIQASEGLKLNSGNTYTDVISFTTSSTSQVTLQSVTAGTYRSGKYFVQITSGTSYQVLELTLLHDGANVYMSQYGEIATGSNLGTFDANIDAGNMNLLFTPVNAVTKVRLTSTLVKQY